MPVKALALSAFVVAATATALSPLWGRVGTALEDLASGSPILDESEVRRVVDGLGMADKTCRSFGAACEPLSQVLKTLFGRRYNPAYADLVVFVDSEGTVHQPLLIREDKIQSHLYGARNVWAVLVWDLGASSTPPAVEARITTLSSAPPNPLGLLLAAAKFTPASKEEEKETTSPPVKIALRRLGKEGSPNVYFGLARFSVAADTVSRISLYPVAIEVTKLAVSGDPATGQTGVSRKTVYNSGGEWPAQSHSVHGEFSNARDSWVAASVGVGLTGNVRGTRLGEGEGDRYHIAGYAFGKIYLARRPAVRVGPHEARGSRFFKSSFALMLGTNVTGDAFEEIVVGFAWGHLAGRTGVFACVNSIAPSATLREKRRERLVMGLEYTF